MPVRKPVRKNLVFDVGAGSGEFTRLLQKRKIGKSNPRTQRLRELEGEKDTFVESYNAVHKLIKMNGIKIR